MNDKEPFQISVDGQFQFEIDPETARSLDFIDLGDRRFHILREGKSLEAELIEADYAARRFVFNIGGERFETHIADRYERLILQMGFRTGGTAKINAVKAPMPGLVRDILVAPGQKVEKGDALLILEAMKMENLLKAAGDGVVKSVMVEKGATVDKGVLLIEME